MHQIGYICRLVAQYPGTDHIGRQYVSRGHQHVAAVHATVDIGALFGRVNAVQEGEHGRHFIRQSGNPEMQVLFRVGIMAFFAGRNVDHALEIFYAKADNGHGMRF